MKEDEIKYSYLLVLLTDRMKDELTITNLKRLSFLVLLKNDSSESFETFRVDKSR